MNSNDDKVRVKLERHLWPDEIAELERKRNRSLKIIVSVLSLIIVFILGYLLGVGLVADDETVNKENKKFSEMLDIMGNSWYFADEYSDVREHLLDRAYYGMTSNEDVDLHTTYMSKEEVDFFMSSINMHFVGIGVQFYNVGEYSLVKKVFKNSPAEKAGVLAGDVFNNVNGVDAKGLSSDELSSLVKGEEGSVVKIEFLRQNEPIVIEITRGEINATAYGEMIDDKIGYIELYQFGDTTATEVESYLNAMNEAGMRKLIIDVRDNGGGYLDTLEHILNYLLPPDTIIMQQVYSNKKVDYSKTTGGEFKNIEEIVVLINENSASASEVLTMALKEKRDDVTVVGVKSYGKGTVQVTKSFSDGSALKYTTSKWLSPNGVWINKKGIEPDVEVLLPEVINASFPEFKEGEVYKIDSVNEKIKSAQLGLQFLGYDIDRIDGYFSEKTFNALINFQTQYQLNPDGVLDDKTFQTIFSATSKEWSLNKERDLQFQKAVEILND